MASDVRGLSRRVDRSRPHGGYVAVVAENAQGARVQQEVLAGARRQPEPARRQHAQHVAVREQRDVARRPRAPGRSPDPTRAPTCSGVSPPGASVPEDQPARSPLRGSAGRQPLVLAVVPLDQVGLDDRAVAEPGQLAGLAVLAGSGLVEHERERLPGQHGPQPLGEPPARSR